MFPRFPSFDGVVKLLYYGSRCKFNVALKIFEYKIFVLCSINDSRKGFRASLSTSNIN